MNDDLRQLLEAVHRGDLAVTDALARIRPTVELGFANVDLTREQRCGFAEVIYCAGKTPDESTAIAREILLRSPRVLLTRAGPEHAEALAEVVPAAEFHPRARCITVDPTPLPRTGLVAVVAAGTADLHVAEEAVVCASIMGAEVATHWDVGVAGLHRLISRIGPLRQARVIVAVAGMEGALASVVGGLVDRPVIAVPTSVGEGLHLDGIVPTMVTAPSSTTMNSLTA